MEEVKTSKGSIFGKIQVSMPGATATGALAGTLRRARPLASPKKEAVHFPVLLA